MRKIVFIFLVFSLSLSAQEPFYYFINTENGLPTNEVYEILLSQKDGMLYIATNKGLAKYNGSTVEEIVIPGEKELAITSLDEDMYGNIYFASFRGEIWCYDGSTVFMIYKISSRNGYPNLEVFQDSLVLFSRDANSFFSYHHPTRKMDSVLVCKKNTNTGLLTFYGRNEQEVFIKTDSLEYSYSLGGLKQFMPNNFSSIDEIEVNGQNYFIGLNNDSRYSSQANFPYYLKRNESKVDSLRKINDYHGERLLRARIFDDKIYLLTDKGVLIYNYTFEKLAHWFPDLSISFIQRDATGTLWLSTLQKGIIGIPSQDVRVAPFLLNKDVTNIMASPKGIQFTTAELEYGTWPMGEKLQAKLDRRVFMYQTNQFKEASIFVTLQNNVFFNSQNRMEKKFPLGSNVKWLSYFSDSDDYLISTTGGCSYFGDENNTEIFKSKYSFYEASIISSGKNKGKERIDLVKGKSYTHYYNRRDKRIYIGTRNGFFLLTPDKKKKELTWNGKMVQSDFLYPTEDGKIIWSGGRTGLYKIGNEKVLNRWGENEGLLKTGIGRLRQQGDTLIIICEKGVQLFTETNGFFATFTSANYLPKAVCVDACIYNHELYVATTKGVYVLPLVKSKKDLLNLTIASLWSKNSKLIPGEKIEYKNNSLLFKLNGASLNSRGDFTYNYRLLPTGKEWISQVSTNNEIRFSSLREGSYTLEVQLRTPFSVSKIDSYSFTIAPPWYRSWWFYLLIALVVLFIIAMIFYVRIRQVRKKAEYSRRIKQSEITAIKAQMNPHFVFNALNSVQSLVIKKDFENTNEYLGMFSDLVRKTLQNSGNNEIDLSKELEMLELYLDLEKLRFGDEIKIDFEVELTTHEQKDIMVPPMFIQPFVENVFKHGLLHKVGEKKLDILIKKTHQKLIVLIKDNGIGRKRASEMQARKQGAGFSTEANQKRMELLNEIYNQEINVSITDVYPNQENCGTLVELKLPLKKYDH